MGKNRNILNTSSNLRRILGRDHLDSGQDSQVSVGGIAMIVRCQMFASCGSARHFTCDKQEPHEGNTEWFSCPNQIVFGFSSMVRCFETDICSLRLTEKDATLSRWK